VRGIFTVQDILRVDLLQSSGDLVAIYIFFLLFLLSMLAAMVRTEPEPV
jgi:hypothetical protein